METFTQAELELARWLLEHEDARTETAAAGRQAWERLVPRLANIFTTSGCAALLGRGLYLTAARFPEVEHAREGPGLDRLPQALAGLLPDDATEAVVSLWATILHLLITFIGQGLTLRILSEIWPGAALGPASPADEEVQP